ncbi:MAG: hypothetical protein J6866_03705 [Victivallales bacterium]|nr:hypothetical protein [Victivallales bacterium]
MKEYGPAIIKKVQDYNKYAKYKPVLDIINNNWEEGKGLSDKGYELLQKPEYDGIVYDLSRMMANPDPNSKLPKEYEDKVNVLRRDPRTNDLLQGKFSNDKAIGYGQRWGKWQDEEIDKGLGEYFGNDGIGGFFKNILSWLAKNTGIGGWFVRRGIADRLGTVMPGSNTGATGNVGAAGNAGP